MRKLMHRNFSLPYLVSCDFCLHWHLKVHVSYGTCNHGDSDPVDLIVLLENRCWGWQG